MFWRVLKWTIISVLILVVLVGATVGIVLNIVFTPEKLTPIVEKYANEYLDADVRFKSIDLTFYSTFPNFGIDIEDGSMVTKVFQDTTREAAFARTDSLVSFKRCQVVVNPIAFLKRQNVIVRKIILVRPDIYAYVDTNGVPGWDVVRAASADTLVDADTVPADTMAPFRGRIDIRNIRIVDGNLIFDDRFTQLYTRIEGLDLHLKGSFAERRSRLFVDLGVKDLLLWQEGDLLVKRTSLDVETGMRLNRDSLLYVLDKAEVAVNGIKFGVEGRLRADTLSRLLDVDLAFGVNVPSLKTLLELVPETIMKRDQKVDVGGDVKFGGTLKGKYGKNRVPVLQARFLITGGHAKYAGMPHSLEQLDVDVEGIVDLQKEQPSFLKINKFVMKGQSVDIDLSGRVEQLLADPRVMAKLKADVDFDLIPKIFPLEEGVSMTGNLSAALNADVLLSDVRNRNFGKLDIRGGCNLKDVRLVSERDSFLLRSKSVGLGFGTNMADSTILQGKNLLSGIFGFDSVDISVKDKLEFHVDTSYVKMKTSPLRDTAAVASMSADLHLGWMDLRLGDSLRLRTGNTRATLALKPSKRDKKIPFLSSSLKMDSLRVRARKSHLRLAKADFALVTEKNADTTDIRKWLTAGTVGFKDLRLFTPMFPLRVQVPGTRLTLKPGEIRLKGAAVKVGRSDVLLTGRVFNLAEALTKGGDLRADLEVKSRRINCNQLMRAMEIGAKRMEQWELAYGDEITDRQMDSLEMVTDSVAMADSTSLAVFVVPPKVDFHFATEIGEVRYGRLKLEDIHGELVMKDQCVEMTDLSLRFMAANVQTTLIYKASTPRRAYAGFDLRMDDIDVASLIGFMPSLDSIVPMLRSFEGQVDFHIAGESDLDSTLMIDLPTLRSAAYLDGRNLVLMDGETFAEISKMLMFKNKERNLIDSVSVDFLVKDGVIEIFPFLVEMDRYKVAVGGEHKVDMTFDYHISVLKSPVPFRLGVDVYGSLDDMKFKLTKAKYKDLFIPSRRAKVDSAQLNVRAQIRRMLQSARE